MHGATGKHKSTAVCPTCQVVRPALAAIATVMPSTIERLARTVDEANNATAIAAAKILVRAATDFLAIFQEQTSREGVADMTAAINQQQPSTCSKPPRGRDGRK